MSITVENIRDWSGFDVVDSSGDKIGSLESVYFDTSTDEPEFVGVQIGLIGKRIVFAPLANALVSPKYLKVHAAKKLVKDGPGIDSDGELTRDLEPTLYTYYGLPFVEGAAGERRLGRR